MTDVLSTDWLRWPGGADPNTAELDASEHLLCEEVLLLALRSVHDGTSLELPGVGMRHPLAPLATLVDALGVAAEAGFRVGPEHWGAATRRMLWALRAAITVGPARRRAVVTVANQWVDRWLDTVFGPAGDSAQRGQKALQIGFALLGLLERQLLVERRLAAVALAVHAGCVTPESGERVW